MSQRYYTNTGKLRSIVGLFATTVLVTYATTNASEIVEGTKNLIKKAASKVNSIAFHSGKQEVAIVYRDSTGRLYDSGQRTWK